MFKIRRMQEQDAETVRQVDRLAFLPFLQKQNPSGPIPVRFLLNPRSETARRGARRERPCAGAVHRNGEEP